MNEDVKRILNGFPKAGEAWQFCKENGIIADVEKRWEDGVPHHPEAETIFDLIQVSDYVFGGDYFCWKVGGDGDNGETLMFALSVLLEMRDKGYPIESLK